MVKLKGLFLLVPSIAIVVVELKYLILDNIGNSDTVTLDANQYWALAIPVFIGTLITALLVSWVGYTMVITKDPIRMTYDSAYEEAAGELSSQENKSEK